MSDEDIEIGAGWIAEAGQFTKTLCELRFLDGVAGSYIVHDWAEHNPWAANRPKRIAAARAAAGKRWQRKQDAGSIPSACDSHETAMPTSPHLTTPPEKKTLSVAIAPVADDETDPRHSSVRGLIQKLHVEKFGVKCEWDASEAKALARLLSANPGWPDAQISAMVRNRFDSEELASDRPRKWLSSLGSYATGPLDRYGKPRNAKANGYAAALCASEIARRQQSGEEWRA